MNNWNNITTGTTTNGPVSWSDMRAMIDKIKSFITPNPTLPLCSNPLQASMPVKRDPYLTVSRKAPTRRRRRLWRHWMKTREVPNPNVYVVGGFIVGHPDTIARMAEALERINERKPGPEAMEYDTTV